MLSCKSSPRALQLFKSSHLYSNLSRKNTWSNSTSQHTLLGMDKNKVNSTLYVHNRHLVCLTSFLRVAYFYKCMYPNTSYFCRLLVILCSCTFLP